MDHDPAAFLRHDHYAMIMILLILGGVRVDSCHDHDLAHDHDPTAFVLTLRVMIMIMILPMIMILLRSY